MDKTKLQTLKGFRDFLPKEAKKRQYVLEKIKRVFELYGFEPLETPALEYKELLLGKYGPEANKLIYSFQDQGGRDVALRYDQTVPTARILSTNSQTLPMPFRRYQMQNVWRSENPQSGRFREFLQCDADIYGSSSPLADAEIIALTNSVFEKLGFKNFKIFVNSRKILIELMHYASIPEAQNIEVISEIDKLDRKSKEEVINSLLQSGLSKESIDHLFHHLEEEKPTEEIDKVTKAAINLGVPEERLVFQARLARGLDYYTGTIFEVKIDEYKAGSVAGGGRYDNLIKEFSGLEIPAVGIAFGFDRTIEAMDQLDLFPQKGKRSGILVTIFKPEFSVNSLSVAKTLRESGLDCELFPDENQDLRKQLKYADKKGVKWLIVVGPDEVKKESVILKDLETGHQEDIKLNDLVKRLTMSND